MISSSQCTLGNFCLLTLDLFFLGLPASDVRAHCEPVVQTRMSEVLPFLLGLVMFSVSLFHCQAIMRGAVGAQQAPELTLPLLDPLRYLPCKTRSDTAANIGSTKPEPPRPQWADLVDSGAFCMCVCVYVLCVCVVFR